MNAEKQGQERYARRLRRISLIYGVLAIFIIPIYTVLYATKADLITQNMSIIGGSMGGYRALVLWGVLSALFYLGFTLYLFMLTRFTNPRVRRMLFAGCAMLIFTVILPFVPEVWPRAAQLHNILAMAAPIVIILTLYFFVFYLARCDRAVYKKALTALNTIVMVSALLLFATGTSGLLEVVVTVAMCGFLFMLLVWLAHSEKLDLLEAMQEAEKQYMTKRKKRLRNKQK